MASGIRQNFHAESEAGINKNINLVLETSYTYLSMAFHFDRDDIALQGTHKYFVKASEKHREYGVKLMKFQNQRGGRIVLKDIKKPDGDEWGQILDAMQNAQTLEKRVNESILELHKVGETHHDEQLCEWLEDNFLNGQVEIIKELGDHIANLKRVGDGLGEYMFDHETLEG